MNREQKRSYVKKLKQKGFSTKEIEFALKIIEKKNDSEEFCEGEKVTLNYPQITTQPDYIKNKETNNQEKYVVKHREFVENSIGKIYTIEYEEKYKDNHYLMCLKEDKNDPKILWHSFDLIKIKD